MTKIGIITRCKSENPIKGIIKKPRITELDKGIFLGEIPSCKDKRTKQAIEKAINALNVNEVILASDLKEWGGEYESKTDLFYKIAPRGAISLAEHFKIDTPFALAVREKEAGKKAEHIIKKLIFKCKGFKILTDNPQAAQKIADSILEKYGAVAQAFPYNYSEKDGLTVDLDEECIHILGQARAQKFEISEEGYGLDIDLVKLFWAKNKDFDKIVIKSCALGKNKLTLEGF